MTAQDTSAAYGPSWRRTDAFLMLLAVAGAAAAHGVADADKQFLEQSTGPQIGAFLYLGAKHMMTGYDHLLFLFGVIFFLDRMKQVATYVRSPTQKLQP